MMPSYMTMRCVPAKHPCFAWRHLCCSLRPINNEDVNAAAAATTETRARLYLVNNESTRAWQFGVVDMAFGPHLYDP